MSEAQEQKPDPREGKCGHCGHPFTRRLASNDPAYCSYECGVNGQPDHVGAALHVMRNGN